MENGTNRNKTIKSIYEIIDSFLVEAKDQNGNERSLERLNQDRHLAAERLGRLCQDIRTATIRECIDALPDIQEDTFEDLYKGSLSDLLRGEGNYAEFERISKSRNEANGKNEAILEAKSNLEALIKE